MFALQLIVDVSSGLILMKHATKKSNPGVYTSRNIDDELPLVDIVVTGTFGDAYLS